MDDAGESRRSLRSGELARLAGVSADTIRHYERKGLIGPARRLPNGYRQYEPAALDRVRTIQAALALGFTLDELARIFGVRRRGAAPCRQVRALAEAKLADATARLRDLEALIELLRSTIDDWDRRLNGTPDGAPASLLESLAGGVSSRRPAAFGRRPGGVEPRSRDRRSRK